MPSILFSAFIFDFIFQSKSQKVVATLTETFLWKNKIPKGISESTLFGIANQAKLTHLTEKIAIQIQTLFVDCLLYNKCEV